MLLLHMLEKRMDEALRKQWELVVHELDIPTFSDFTDFLEKHCTSSKVIVGTSQKYSQPKSIDNGNHRCSEFMQKDPQAHFSMVKNKRLRINCQAAYQVKSCPSTKSCQFCNACHNTMLLSSSDKPTTTVAQSKQDEVPVDTP
ncbi:hypothetical protein PR048_024758 [Dryococelus australis]|uniref:Uncharacterized protein n=1 Tax=Dryococelus australis TaxID=614101 RepID=A0ABQ9GPJ1_9NEOP|nr:hypothetical protein PR048_024758 [Dryococelus australis]